MLDALAGHLLAVHGKDTHAALARTRAGVFEVKDERVLAGLECLREEIVADSAADATLPAEARGLLGFGPIGIRG